MLLAGDRGLSGHQKQHVAAAGGVGASAAWRTGRGFSPDVALSFRLADPARSTWAWDGSGDSGCRERGPRGPWARRLRGPAGPGPSTQRPRSGFVGRFGARLPEGFPPLCPYSDPVTCPLRHQTKTLLACLVAYRTSRRPASHSGPAKSSTPSEACGNFRIPELPDFRTSGFRNFRSLRVPVPPPPRRAQPGLLCVA